MKSQFKIYLFPAQFFIVTLLFAVFVPHVFATNVTEPPDFSNTLPGSNYTLTLGTNTFSGTVTTPSDGSDIFQVTVPAGMRITQASKNFSSGGSVSGENCSFNYEDLSGTGVGTFTSGYPLYDGTYQASVHADFSVGNAWSMTFVVGPAPDYRVSTDYGRISIVDYSDNSDTLNITNPVADSILFAAAGRTFSIDGGSLRTNDSGNLSLSGITDVIVSPENGDNTENISAFSGNSFPGLTIYGGTNSDTVNFNGNITFAPDNYLDVELSDGSTNANSVTINTNVNLITSGDGTITIYSSRNIYLKSGSILQVQDGDLDVEANQQVTPASGSFIGVNLDGATLKSTGAGYVYVYGTGGDGSGGFQLGVQVINGGQIIGGNTGYVIINGNGGNSTGIVNRGVTIYGTGSAVTSSGGPVYVTGNAGTNGSNYGIGVSVLYGAKISAGGMGNVTITGTGAGQSGSVFNQGIELSEVGSLITSSGGTITITGTAGPGGSSGVYMADSSAITTPVAGGIIQLVSDSDNLDSTVNIITTNAASSVTFSTATFGTFVDLGGADAAGNPATLGLTDAELDRVNTAKLLIGLNSGGVSISAPITQPYATNLVIFPGLYGALHPTVSGTDISLLNNGTVTLQFGSAAFPITGPLPDTDYPQLSIIGRMNINGSSLDLANSTYAGNIGDTFTLINNEGTNPIIGTFNGLPEGSFLKLDGQPVRIYYDGGDGNDVVLVRSLPSLSDGSLTNGQWHFTLTGFPTNTYTIQATTNFINWTNIGTATTDTNGNFMFSDTDAFKYPYRFYRTTN